MDNNFKLYLMAFVLFFAGNILQLDEKSTIYMIFALCSLICLIIKLWNETHTQREIITDIVVVGFALLLYTNSKAMTILMLAAFLVASKNIDIKKLLKYTFYCAVVLYIAIIISSQLGIRQNIHIQITRMTGQVAERYGLGFEHPNQLHMYYFIIVLMGIYVYYEKLTWRSLLVVQIINFILYKFSVSRTGMLSVVGLSIVYLIFRQRDYLNKKISRLAAWVFPLCAFVCIFLSKIYTGNVIEVIINKLLQGRVSNSNYFMGKYGDSLFGRNFTSSNKSLILDNSYVILWLKFGILFTVILCILYYIAVKKMIKQGDRADLLCVLMFACYGITEGFLSNIFRNFSLLFLANIICNDMPALIGKGIPVKLPLRAGRKMVQE